MKEIAWKSTDRKATFDAFVPIPLELTRCRKEAMSTPGPLSNEGLVSMAQDGQLTAENLSLEVGAVSFVYRRFGNAHTAAPPLVMLQHFRGNLDSWDPALVDRLAQDREVILVDNRGVGGSTGVVPENVTPWLATRSRSSTPST